MKDYEVDVLIVGGGTGGTAAAVSSRAMGQRVLVVEEFGAVGGQLTTQAVPPDEHPWIESTGCTASYRDFRNRVRNYYRKNRKLTPEALAAEKLNPGGGSVSKLCMEPEIGVAVLNEMLAGIPVICHAIPVSCEVEQDRITSVTFRGRLDGEQFTVKAAYVIDASECGSLLPLANAEYVTGAESQKETGEPHALEGAPEPDNVQAFTWCMVMGWDRTRGSHVIDRPQNYDYWRSYIPPLTPPWAGRLVDWHYCQPTTLRPLRAGFTGDKADYDFWRYRRIRCHETLGRDVDEASVMNWPQNDYLGGSILDKSPEEIEKHLRGAQELTLAMFYWLQTEAPRGDGGTGYPWLYPMPDLSGNRMGLAQAPYIRESRRIRAMFTVTENHIGETCRPDGRAEEFADSVGIGFYRIDLHPSANGSNYIDIGSCRFQIPLRALIPVRIRNLIAGAKNIGTTHITNGCYRLHPVEWNIGEAAGLLAGYCNAEQCEVQQVGGSEEKIAEIQRLAAKRFIPLKWE